MIYFVNQFHMDAKHQIENLKNEEGPDYEAISIANELWIEAYIDVIAKLHEKYILPAFHFLHDGFTQGDASDNEVFEAEKNINNIDGSWKEGESSIGQGPVVYAEWDDDGTEILTDIFTYLDEKYVENMKNKLEEILNLFPQK